MNVLSKYIIDSTRKEKEAEDFSRIPRHVRPVPRLVCRDGFEISVQAGEYHYCAPRNNEGPWDTFECGFPSKPVPELKGWKERDEAPDERSVFGYVPSVTVMLTIEKHGGCVVLEEMK